MGSQFYFANQFDGLFCILCGLAFEYKNWLDKEN